MALRDLIFRFFLGVWDCPNSQHPPGGSWGACICARKLTGKPKWWIPKIRGTSLGFPIIRIMVFWGLYLGSPILGKYQIVPYKDHSPSKRGLYGYMGFHVSLECIGRDKCKSSILHPVPKEENYIQQSSFYPEPIPLQSPPQTHPKP